MTTQNLPRHVGIIMDGNGRWAKQRGMGRHKGHKEGLRATKRIVEVCAGFSEIDCLSLYVFSTENWKRAAEEVSALMGLLRTHLSGEYAFYQKHRICVIHSGDLEALPRSVQQVILTIQEKTRTFKGLVLNLLINYGGKDEIFRAANRCLTALGKIPSEEALEAHLDNAELVPPVDFLIRTGGEKRLSNFSLWHSAYAEIYFSDKLWPEWQSEDLMEAFAFYQNRVRRYGA